MSEIAYSHVHERFHNGYFAQGVENGNHLKMLLHLQDLMVYYDAMRICSAGEKAKSAPEKSGRSQEKT